jgi:hypothetical protein
MHYSLLQSFVCYHNIVFKDLKLSNIQKMFIVVLSKLQTELIFQNFDIYIDELDFSIFFDNSKCV